MLICALPYVRRRKVIERLIINSITTYTILYILAKLEYMYMGFSLWVYICICFIFIYRPIALNLCRKETFSNR